MKHMKITRSKIYLPMAAMILTAALVVSAAAPKQIPFKGTIQAHETDTPQGGGTVSASGSGTGIGILLGEFSFTYELTITLANGTATGSAHFVAANGDSIDTTIAGSSEPTGTPGVLSITEIETITGGTGRFAGAQGSFTVERLVSAATGSTSGSFHGTIASPGAAH
jgi:hypothetical protein